MLRWPTNVLLVHLFTFVWESSMGESTENNQNIPSQDDFGSFSFRGVKLLHLCEVALYPKQ